MLPFGRRVWRSSAPFAALLVVLALPGATRASPTHSRPALVFLLLDTTRADRLGAYGHAPARTPVLDTLAARGIRFARHHANAHATRPSMPQLMSGRYVHRSILRDFELDQHPRELTFLRPDPTAALLPDVLVDAGYQALGASAHPWVVADSLFGRRFERLQLAPVDPRHGHADAVVTVDTALALWRGRDRSRPTFLYVHLMDAHMPRAVPPGEAVVPPAGYNPTGRFEANGEPSFGPRRRRWDRSDASDFTGDDRRWFSAVYDANLAFLDRHLGRLLEAVTADDPGLQHTLVVVTADHGEELGEDGRTDHGDSLADGVQHVPWILAGTGIPAAQVVDRFTEHVDVLPTVLGRLGIPLPPGVHVDGTSCLDAPGRPSPTCGNPAVYYAWEEYRAVRSGTHLLRENRPGSFRARCDGTWQLYEVGPLAVRPADDGFRRERLRRRLERRLDPAFRRFARIGGDPPTRSFVWPARFWGVAPDAPLACAKLGPDTPRAALRAAGWLWSGRGVTVMHADHAAPLAVRVPAPDGSYRVEAGAVPLEPMPWLFGFEHWARKSFLPSAATAWVPLGTWRAERGTLAISLAEATGLERHLLGLKLTPAGAVPDAGGPPAADDDMRRRLEALGYVQ